MQQQTSGEGRSERACPVCGQHSLAVDAPPRIDVLGIQPYSDLIGMGDVRPRNAPGIICLNCGTRWRDLRAFEAGEPEAPPEPVQPGEPGERGADDDPDHADPGSAGEPRG
jgi:hypothetical protein